MKQKHYLPNSRLVGIQLTVSTHAGPQVVFHYPPCSPTHISNKRNYNKKEYTSISTNGLPTPVDSINKSSEFRISKQKSIDENSINASVPSLKTNNQQHELPSDFEQYINNMNSSSDPDISSGLSDSEMSTDYSDLSSSSSDSVDSVSTNSRHLAETPINYQSPLFGIEPKSYINDAPSNNGKKSKPSQISANKLLDMFNNDIISSDGLARRSSLASKLSSVNSIEGRTISAQLDADEDNCNDTELLKELEKNSIIYNEEYFDSEKFQDISKVFGFDSEFVAEICSPDREMCNTSFEFTVDNLCFLGLPMHADENGNWKNTNKRDKKKLSKTSSVHSKGSRRHSINSKDSISRVYDEERVESSGIPGEDEEKYQNPIAIHDPHSADYEKNLNMFHVCFVMNPPMSEYNQRVDDMYHYIVKRLAHVLRNIQAKSFYVSKEVEILMKEREYVTKSSKIYKKLKGSANKAHYLYQRLLVRSSLARALVSCYDNIHKNEIVNLMLDEKVVILQIPMHDEFWRLPQYKIEPVLQGSHLTSILNYKFLESSSNINGKNDTDWNYLADEDNANNDILNYALLLHEEPHIITEKLKLFFNKKNIGGVILRQLVKHIQPNVPIRSYQPLINKLMGVKDMELNENLFQVNILKFCALHLLYWRHARAIIPISSKNTYIVSPLAPLQGNSNDYVSENSSNIYSHKREDQKDEPIIYKNLIEFGKTFPSLPSLVSFLSLLSNGKPRPFGAIIPSKEHKPIYLGALAWLIRHGYVTQLLTYVNIRVDNQIKMSVDEDLEREGFKIASKKLKDSDRKNELQVDNVTSFKKNQSDNKSREVDKNLDDVNNNVISESAIYDTQLNFDYDEPEVEKDYTIILEPERAGAIERRWIVKCVHDQPAEIQVLFNKLLKYFNGKIPMEVVVFRENITRHEIKKVMHALDKYLIELKHW